MFLCLYALLFEKIQPLTVAIFVIAPMYNAPSVVIVLSENVDSITDILSS